MDIDHFKEVNDTYGHSVGDRVLERLAGVLEESIRDIDVPARYGGEEFVFILEEADLAEARTVAERLRQAVADVEFETSRGTFSCTISLGIGIWPDDARDESTLVERTDRALYASKEGGRNQVTAWADL